MKRGGWRRSRASSPASLSPPIVSGGGGIARRQFLHPRAEAFVRRDIGSNRLGRARRGGIRLENRRLGYRLGVRRHRIGLRLLHRFRRGFLAAHKLVVDRERLGRNMAVGGRRRIARMLILILLGACFFLLHLQQALPVRDGDLIIVGVDFAERQETMAVAAIFDEGRLEARLHADNLGEIDIAFELLPGLGLDVEILESATFQHHDAGFFRMGGIDEHTLGHKEANSGASKPRGNPMGARPGGPIRVGEAAGQAGGAHSPPAKRTGGAAMRRTFGLPWPSACCPAADRRGDVSWRTGREHAPRTSPCWLPHEAKPPGPQG